MLKEAAELPLRIRNLMQLCSDAESNLLQAKQCLRSGFLGTLYQHFAKQRAQNRAELLAELRRQPSEHGLDGISDDAFVASGSFVTRTTCDEDDDIRLALSCKERAAGLVESYKAALEVPLPNTTATLLKKQLSQSLVMHDVFKVLALAD